MTKVETTGEIQLSFIQGPCEGKMICLNPGSSLVLGRSSSAQVRIKDRRLSRQHCRISSVGGEWFIEDLGSSNGTYINDLTVSREKISHGDRIDIGSSAIIVFAKDEIPPSMKPCAFCSRQEEGNIEVQGRYICRECLLGDPGGPGLGDHYEVVKKLGEGGMGAVFLARDRKRDRKAALKLILDEDGGKSRKRFLREVRSMRLLSHPNIVNIFEAGEIGNLLYITMEYVDGTTLKDLIRKKKRLSCPFALEVCLQIARALEHAYSREVVHRDVNPNNILLDPQFRAKLTDFGIAKGYGSNEGTAITESGEGKGTLNYISPEQMTDALFADYRADLYSLGATLYHALVGRPPFVAKYTRDLIMMILKNQPELPSKVVPAIPHPVDQFILKAMDKRPEKRHATPTEMIAELESLLQLFPGRKRLE